MQQIARLLAEALLAPLADAPEAPLHLVNIAGGPALDSISTYMIKLGADHLPPGFDGPVDRKVAAAPHVALVRLRMQQVAGEASEIRRLMNVGRERLRPMRRS